MTPTQKNQIARMRQNGAGYKRIATELGLSEGTVKSFCRRSSLRAVPEPAGETCALCGKLLVQTPGAKKRRFCSDQCRLAWWTAHPEALNRKAVYRFTCGVCGTAFESYGDKDRMYCSRACYGLSRRTHR